MSVRRSETHSKIDLFEFTCKHKQTRTSYTRVHVNIREEKAKYALRTEVIILAIKMNERKGKTHLSPSGVKLVVLLCVDTDKLPIHAWNAVYSVRCI